MPDHSLRSNDGRQRTVDRRMSFLSAWRLGPTFMRKHVHAHRHPSRARPCEATMAESNPAWQSERELHLPEMLTATSAPQVYRKFPNPREPCPLMMYMSLWESLRAELLLSPVHRR